MMDINMMLIALIAVAVLLLFLWPREATNTGRLREGNTRTNIKGSNHPPPPNKPPPPPNPPKRLVPGCGCSNCECNGETIIVREKKK